MQERRRSEKLVAKTPLGNAVEVPSQYWEDIEQRDMGKVCENALAINHPPTGLILPFLKEYILVSTQTRCLYRQVQDQWERIDNPLLELLCLVYLINAGPQLLSHKMVSTQELKSAHFFKGPHELKTRPLLARYSNDLEGLKGAAEGVGGEAMDLADAAYKLLAFPKVPLYYLFWKGDQEFGPSLSVLFDRSVEHHLAADAIWGLVNLVSDVLIMGDNRALL